MPGRPLKSLFPYGACSATNRKGERCGCRVVKLMNSGRLVCRFHGSESTGPKTPTGKRIAAMNLVRWRLRRSGQRDP